MSAPTEPMVVAYVINQYPKSSHTFIRREILALERLGVVVERYALRGWDDPAADPADRAEQQRTRYLLQPGAWPLITAALQCLLQRPLQSWAAMNLALSLSRGADRPLAVHLVYWAEACRLSMMLARSGAVHLHAHFGTNAAAVAMLTRVLGGPPFSFTVHGPEEFDKPHALQLSRKASSSAFVVAISSFGRSQLWRWMPLAQWCKVRVVHCGVDGLLRETVATPVPSNSRLVCVGRLCEQKGQLLLLEAAATLVAEGRAFELVLVGDGEMRAEVERGIDALGLRDCVRITGWVDGERVRDELLAARALVLPSFAEGLPVVLMEALALGRPVVTTAIAGIPELVRQGVEGWVVPAGDVTALLSGLRACLDAESARLGAMGAAGRARVLERHDAAREAQRLLDAIRGLPEAPR